MTGVPVIQELEQTAHLVFCHARKDDGRFLGLSFGLCRARGAHEDVAEHLRVTLQEVSMHLEVTIFNLHNPA
jgi:hypothetical protein